MPLKVCCTYRHQSAHSCQWSSTRPASSLRKSWASIATCHSVVLSWRDVRTNYTQIQPRSSTVSFTDHLRNTTLGYVIIKSGLSMHPLLHSLLAPLSRIIVFVLGNQPPPLFLPGVLLSKTCGEQLALKIHLLLRTSALWG